MVLRYDVKRSIFLYSRKRQMVGFKILSININKGEIKMNIKRHKLLLFILLTLLVLSLLSACGPKVEKTPNGDNSQQVDGDKDKKKDFSIKDPELEEVIRQALNKPEGDLSADDMKGLRELSVDNNENPVEELDGLEHAINLEYIELYEVQIKSLDPIANLNKMEYFSFAYSQVEEEPTKFNMPNLRDAVFMETNIRDFSFIKDSPLVSLVFDYCDLEDLDFLAKKDLEYLRAMDNYISDISFLEGMTNLKELIIRGNEISDISVLSSCRSLESLEISYNHIDDISVLRGLDNLEELSCYGNPLGGDDLDLLEELEDRGVDVNF